VTGEWRELHNEELNDLYSPNIVCVIKSRIWRWTGHVTLMDERRGVARVLWRILRVRDHLENPDINGKMI
jgi:hypothetical protein